MKKRRYFCFYTKFVSKQNIMSLECEENLAQDTAPDHEAFVEHWPIQQGCWQEDVTIPETDIGPHGPSVASTISQWQHEEPAPQRKGHVCVHSERHATHEPTQPRKGTRFLMNNLKISFVVFNLSHCKKQL